MKYSEMRGKIFKIDPRNFRRIFHELVVKASILEEKTHFHYPQAFLCNGACESQHSSYNHSEPSGACKP